MRLYAPNIQIPNAPPVGLRLTWVNGSTVTVAAGAVPMRDRNSSANTPRYTMAVLPAALTKNLSPWVAGNNQGSRFGTSAGTGDTTHYFLIRDRATGLVDVGSDINADGSQIPTTYDIRLIGSIKRQTGDLDLIPFRQLGNYFQIFQILEFSTANLSTTENNPLVLSAIPDGIVVRPLLRVDILLATAGTSVILGSGTPNNSAPVINSALTVVHRVITSESFSNTSRSLRLWATSANANITLLTLGYYHPLDFYW